MIKQVIAGLGVVAALGVAAMPVAGSFAVQDDEPVSVSVTVGATIGISTTSPATFGMTPNQMDSKTTTVNVTTNNLNGYVLQVSDKDAETALVSAEGARIEAVDGALVAGSTPGWNISGGLLTNAAVPAAGTQLKVYENTNSAKKYINENTTITYTVATSNVQPQGTYTNEITYTATARP